MKDKIITGTPRHPIYCKICKKEYIDMCTKHYMIKGSWRLGNIRTDGDRELGRFY